MRIAWPLLLVMMASPVADESTPLVTGTDLAQFDLVGITSETIAIEAGEVRLTGKPIGYFATRRDYQDFVLSFDFKFDRPEDHASDATFRGNGGALLRIARPHKVWPDCVEVQLAQADPGSLFAIGGLGFDGQANPDAQRKAIKAVGEWNRVTVTCKGRSIVSSINGVEVARGEAEKPSKGPIGWQSQGMPIRYRDLRIKALD